MHGKLKQIILFGGNSVPVIVQNPVVDTFTDTNGVSLPSHTMNVGSGWTANIGTWYIQSNHLEPNSYADGDIATTDTGITDYTLTVTITPFDSGGANPLPGVLFRFLNTSNYYLLQMDSRLDQVLLYRNVAGSFTLMQTVSTTINSLQAYAVSIAINGSTLAVLLDGAQIISRTDIVYNPDATKIGFRVGKSGSPATRPQFDTLNVLRSAVQYKWFSGTPSVSNPILTLGANGTWEDVDVANPDVFFDTPNNRWVMNYSGFDGTKWQTGLAYSTDLLNWTKEAANPVFALGVSEGNIAANGSIAYKSGTYYLAYQAGKSGATRICAASSPDLINWTRMNSTNPVLALGSAGQFDEKDTFDPFVRLMPDGVTFEMFYGGDNNASARGIGRATSTDFVTWTKSGVLFSTPTWANFAGNLGEPSVLFNTGSSYTIFTDTAITDGARFISQWTTSDSGSTWQSKIKAVDKGASGWNSAQVFDSFPVLYNGILYMFFAGGTVTGGNANLNAQIGVSTMPWSYSAPTV